MTKLLLLCDQREAVLLNGETRLFQFFFTTNSNRKCSRMKLKKGVKEMLGFICNYYTLSHKKAVNLGRLYAFCYYLNQIAEAINTVSYYSQRQIHISTL